jgi:hypothetical protein
MPYETLVHEVQHLGKSHEVDGAVADHLLEDENKHRERKVADSYRDRSVYPELLDR